jgi:hypothetical protein
MALTKKYLINGPVNVARLTDGNKILYIFGDCHVDPADQTQCKLDDDHPSIDIDVLLFEFMKFNKEKQFDLFVEDGGVSKLKQTYNTTSTRKQYIAKISNLFTDNLIQNKNEIKINPKYPNFRFHNMNIRNNRLLFFNTILSDITLYRHYIDIDYFLYKLYEFEKLITISFEDSEKNNKDIKKILNKYSNNTIKKKINELYQDIYVKNYNKILKMIRDTRNMLLESEKLTDVIINIFFNSWDNIRDVYINNSFLITDLYFIRRFLDKDYINNSILYTGNHHLVDISFILIKYFNFKLTNIYHNPNNIDINNQFMKKDYTFDYITNFSFSIVKKTSSNQIYQCVNLFDFPENFK